MLRATIVYPVLRGVLGKRTSPLVIWWDAAKGGVKALGLVVLVAIAVGLGSLLLVIPGWIVAAFVWVAIPVKAVEQLSAVGSIRRSSFLMKGYKLKATVLNILSGVTLQLTLLVLILLLISPLMGVFGDIAVSVAIVYLYSRLRIFSRLCDNH